MSQLGRISGPLLESNLLRDGIPLAFETDLLYFDVTNNRLGVNKIPSSYDLDIDGLTRTNNIIVDNAATIDNVIISAPSTFTTSVGPINIVPTQPNALITYGRMTSTNLYFNDNTIGSFLNSNVELRPNASGTTEFYANTNITGDLTVQGVYPLGSISVTGNLGTVNNIIIGDSILDRVVVNTDFTQDIIPGLDNIWSLGENTGDSSPRRWNEMRIVNETNISLYLPQAVNVSDQMRLDGVINKIFALQSNEDILLSPDTGVTRIESVKFGVDTTSVILVQTLDNPNPVGTSNNDYFGSSVAISGSRLIVGAVNEDDANLESGKAYVYDLGTNSLLYTLNNPNAIGSSADDNFGNSVGISDLYAIVGARGESNVSALYSYQGKAYIFNAATGALLHTLNNPNPAPTNLQEDMFGWQVDISGSQAIVSAPVFNGTHSGSAHIFNAATGALLHTLSNPDPFVSTSDRFGYSAAISASYAIVGAPQEDETGNSNSGKAYIFNAATGTLLFTLNNPNSVSTPADDLFGTNVAISESYAVVGARNERQAGTLDPGSGVVYIFDPATGVLLRTLTNPNPFGQAFYDKFGSSVAISGSRLVVGASLASDGISLPDIQGAEGDAASAINRSGKAYIFDISTGALLHTLDNPNAFGTVSQDYFGRPVAISDSYTVAAAIREDDAAGSNSGKVYIFSAPPANESVITNLNNTALQFASTGIGYLKFDGTNGFIVPTGTDAERPISPELGDTRWNTDQEYLECYDGTVYVVSTGGGISVTQELMEDLGNIYTLILG